MDLILETIVYKRKLSDEWMHGIMIRSVKATNKDGSIIPDMYFAMVNDCLIPFKYKDMWEIRYIDMLKFKVGE